VTEAARHFTREYEEHATLRDGTPVRLRLLTPEDKGLLRTGFEKLSPESRYARFLSPKLALTDDELCYLTDIDQEDHFALGAVRRDTLGEPVGLGIARFIKLADSPGTAEAAITVADEVHGRGLGKLLFLRLCAAAAERGVEKFRCEVLGSNTGMAALLAAIAPDRTIEVGQGVMTIELALPNVDPCEPVIGPPPHGPMYRLFRASAEDVVEWTEAVRKLWRRDRT
jgi:GNAT superfamily N-acetyltransferase